MSDFKGKCTQFYSRWGSLQRSPNRGGKGRGREKVGKRKRKGGNKGKRLRIGRGKGRDGGKGRKFQGINEIGGPTTKKGRRR